MADEEIFLKETEALHNLRALQEIEKNPQISQRELSGRLGIALGITNSLLKTLVRKGLVKIRGENNRSLTYHLTHAGVLAKSALAVRWTLNTIDYYRQTRLELAEKLSELAAAGAVTTVLHGEGELLEIAAIVAPEAGLQVIGVVDGRPAEGRVFLGAPVLDLERLGELEIDAVVVCGEEPAIMEKLGRELDAGTKIVRLF